MKRTRLPALPPDVPREIVEILGASPVYDSSCSNAARVFFIDRGDGYFLKRAPKGTLAEEAALTRIFADAGLGPEVLLTLSAEDDWMLTRKVPGEDGTHLLDEPAALCDLLGPVFRDLHDRGLRIAGDRTLPDRTAAILASAECGIASGVFHTSLHPERYGIRSVEDARAILEDGRDLLRPTCFVHGDACLPNVMFEDGRFTGFIDCGGAGRGDRHNDLFWTVWSLGYNLKTDAWGDRFLDAYGRDAVDPERMLAAAAAEAVAGD
ncbi:MAG: aminoglycoside 3'-phosphotransferase [Clostridia bacterium]|nr:aminoglycoside 3'-phosphotransferase [Clostridia bacterium]